MANNSRSGSNEYVDEISQQANEAYKNWVLSGKWKYGHMCDIKITFIQIFINRNEQTLRANSIAKKLFIKPNVANYAVGELP